MSERAIGKDYQLLSQGAEEWLSVLRLHALNPMELGLCREGPVCTEVAQTLLLP